MTEVRGQMTDNYKANADMLPGEGSIQKLTC